MTEIKSKQKNNSTLISILKASSFIIVQDIFMMEMYFDYIDLRLFPVWVYVLGGIYVFFVPIFWRNMKTLEGLLCITNLILSFFYLPLLVKFLLQYPHLFIPK